MARPTRQLGKLLPTVGSDDNLDHNLILDPTFAALNQSFLKDVTDETISEFIQPTPSYVPHFSSTSGGVVVSAQVPAELVRMLDIVVVDPRLPMRTRSDLIREACYHYIKALVDAYQSDNPLLKELIASEEMLNLMDDLRERQDRLHRIAISLRDMLCVYLGRDDMSTAMIALRRFYLHALSLSPAETESYLSLIRDLPVGRFVAFNMTDWSEKIDDKYIPSEQPSADGHTSDEGIPPSSTESIHTVRPTEKKRPVGRPPSENPTDRQAYMRNYMQQYRHPEGTNG